MERESSGLPALVSPQNAARACMMAAAVTTALACLRIYYGISLSGPGLQLTTGLEEEALFSIWSNSNGEPTYRDLRDAPFSHSYFNWLFYVAYAAVVKISVPGDAGMWIPVVTHLTTLVATLGGAIVFALFLRRQLPYTAPYRTPVSIAAAILAFFNPLTGFWIITARPDVASLALEAGAFLFAVRHFQRGSNGDLWIAIGLTLAAWSFKQTGVVIFGSLVLALLIHREWRKSAIACASMAACAALPFLAYGQNYFENAYLIQAATSLSVGHGFENLSLSAMKAPVIPCALTLLGIAAATDWKRMAARVTTFEVAAFLASFVFAAITGAKAGSSQNYYFLPGCLAVWWLVTIQARHLPVHALARNAAGALFILAMALQALAAAAILSGRAGRIDTSADGEYMEYLHKVLPARTPPILVLTRSGNLPWVQPSPPHFVFGYLYDAPIVRNLGYRSGGLEGMVQSGYFNTVAVPKLVPPDLAMQLPAEMTLAAEDKYFRYFSRPSQPAAVNQRQ